jgi:F0F1-type ATP synthase membrane subunit c/vacuolar-type H+-ATPase subunit K
MKNTNVKVPFLAAVAVGLTMLGCGSGVTVSGKVPAKVPSPLGN